LQSRFWVEADKYQVLPLDASGLKRMISPKPSIVAGRTEFTYTAPITGIPQATAPSILNRSFTVTANVEVPNAGGEGMLTTTGGRFGGWAFYVLKGKPVFVYDLLDLARERVESKSFLSPGSHTVVFDFTYDGPGFGKGGTGVITVDGVETARQKMAKTIPFLLEAGESFDVGSDTGTGVEDNDYQPPFPFTGTLNKLTVKLGPSQITPAQQKDVNEKISVMQD
jgi:arylsulfatase